MQRAIVAVFVGLLALGCGRAAARDSKTPFDPLRFVDATIMTANSNIDLGAMVAHRGRALETRQLGAAIQKQQSAMRDAFAAVARRRKHPVPAGIEPRKAALRENLAILKGEVFDRGYALAMSQDFDALARSFRDAAKSDDAEVAALAKQFLPEIKQQQKAATDVLGRLGGTPFV